MSLRTRVLRPLSFALALSVGAVGASAEGVTAIVGAHVVDVGNGRVVENQTILLEGDRITGVQPADRPVPDGAVFVDATGLYAIPGLIDSHVHYGAPDVYDPLMIAYGVALVREMGADTSSVITLRDARETGETKGPRMRVTGAIVDGSPPFWPFSEAVDTPEEGRAAVRKLHGAGVDFIKVYQGLKPDVHAAVCDEAQKLGLMPFGHVPTSLTVEQAIANGQRTIEHLTGFDALLRTHIHPDEEPATNFAVLGRTWAELGDVSDEQLADVVAPYANKRVAISPTLAVFDGVFTFATVENDPNERYHPQMMRAFWDNGPYKDWGRAVAWQRPGLLRTVKALHDAGAVVIAGTDLANPGVVAGLGIHLEMEMYVEAGLSPADALRSATTTPAAFFGFDDLGAIAPGMEASLLLVGANPLDDISATSDIRTVVHRGDIYSESEIEALKDSAAEAAVSAGVVADALDDGRFTEPEFSAPGEVVAQGVYAYKWGNFDAGTEMFRVMRNENGYQLIAQTRTAGGPQPPYVMTMSFDDALAFNSGSYRVLRGDALPVVYERDGDSAIATSGEEVQTLPIGADTLLTGPAASVDYATLQNLDIEVGETVTPPYVSFGNPSWKWNPVEITITRLEDGAVTLPDGREIATRVFLQVLPIPGMGEFRVTSHIDDLGVVVDSTLKMPMGELTIELTEYTRNW